MNTDLRKPFYDYAMRGPHSSGGAAFVFADWAIEFMPDATPEWASQAYVAARTR